LAFSVFAVEDTCAQITWDTLPADEVTLEVGDATVAVTPSPPLWRHRAYRAPLRVSPNSGGPGVWDAHGLEPDTSYDVCVSGPSLPRRRVAGLRTLAPPPGRLMARVATVSDCHVGAGPFGMFGTIEDGLPTGDDWEPHPVRCARAAVAEGARWGADLLVVKGDLTANSEPAEFHEMGRLLACCPVPVVACLGNHDDRHRVPGAAILAEHGVTAHTGPAATDVPGLRVVLGHTPHPRLRRGFLSDGQIAQLATLAAGAPGVPAGHAPAVDGRASGALVLLHHQLELSRWRRAYPPGVAKGQAVKLVDALAGANPRALVSGGHTHRCRRSQRGPVTVTEVGSTKDYPGVWAGYAVHEGGIRQVIRRIAEPSALAWTEVGAAALGGVWAPWAAGRLADRCFTVEWADPRRGHPTAPGAGG
jgi:Icc protein